MKDDNSMESNPGKATTPHTLPSTTNNTLVVVSWPCLLDTRDFYTTLGIPIAAGALVPLLGMGWLLNPMIAGAAMSFSSVSVIVNALRLRAVALS